MSSVYFDPAVGGDGSTVTDDSNATTGLANGGHRTRFVPSLAQVVAVASNVVTKAQAASAAAATAVNAPGTQATSTTSVAIGTGSKSFNIQTGKAFAVGQFVIAASAANVGNFMLGQITAHNSTTGALTVNVTITGGSGTYADWSIAVSAPGAGDVTLTGTQTLTNKTITSVVLNQTKAAIAASAIDLATANYFSKTISGTTTFTVSNTPATGTAASFILDLTNGGSATITWWSGMKWAGGTAPTLTSSGRDVLGFFTHDGGTTWTGLVLGKDVK
jgi:hypothetical protein